MGLQPARPASSEAAPPDPFGKGPGVLGRADQLIEVRPGGQALAARLLSRTWIVNSLATAFALRGRCPSGLRLVTLDGDVIEVNGPLVLGAQHTGGGLVSRRSELRSLREEKNNVGKQIIETRREISRIVDNVEQGEAELARRDVELRDNQATLADCQVHRRTIQDRCERVKREREAWRAEQRQAEADIQQWREEQRSAEAELLKTEEAIAELEQQLDALNRQAERVDGQRAEAEKSLGAAGIELAKAEQQLAALKDRQSRFLEDRRERSRAVNDARTHWESSDREALLAERAVLKATSEAAQLYLDKEAAARHVDALAAELREHRARQIELENIQQLAQRKMSKLGEQTHRCELSLNEQTVQRATVAQRLREDYGIDISQGEPEDEQAPGQRDEIEAEIVELRQKLNSMGAVNMEALDELDELEERFQDLSGQLDDLTRAKEALERIIHRINADSRRLFLETLEAIRINFQALYRKAFGGGRADLVLEDPDNALESGVDIVATPPGKPSFNNSLLSGGEKALTAVALLLAIFQFRPSPFCVLDEVDAPFDEANVGRFRRSAARVSRVDEIRDCHALQKDDDRGRHAVRSDHAGVRRLQTRLRPLRRRQRRWPHQPGGHQQGRRRTSGVRPQRRPCKSPTSPDASPSAWKLEQRTSGVRPQRRQHLGVSPSSASLRYSVFVATSLQRGCGLLVGGRAFHAHRRFAGGGTRPGRS